MSPRARPRQMIVAAQPEAAEEGALILARGGNAIDAAITCALVQGVVDPQMAGIAGFAAGIIHLADRRETVAVDAPARAPLAARPDMWTHLLEGEARDGFGFVVKGAVNDIGYQAVGVPGCLRAFHEAQQRYGTLPWADVVAPAIAHARAGVTVRPHMYFNWTAEEGAQGRADGLQRLEHTAEGRRLYFRADGTVLQVGDTLHQDGLAETLEAIATGGADAFYTGPIAQRIAEDMAANGGLITTEDLARYRTRWSPPLSGRYRDLDLATNHPPGGGLMLMLMLNILEGFDLSALGHNSPAYLQVVAEAMKAATRAKDESIGDPAFVDVPVAALASKDHAATIAARIRAGERFTVERLAGGGGQPDTPHTTHVSVVDKAGNAVSLTHSLGSASGAITPGLGFMYNNCMAVFDPRPGRTGSIAPGKARFSSICPSILFREGRPEIVIGAPGGTQIAMGVLQAILNVVDHGMTMTEAVSAPRFSATSDAIDLSNRIPRFVESTLQQAGYATIRSPYTFTFAAVHGLRRVRDDRGTGGEGWDGGADPGHDGVALGVD